MAKIYDKKGGIVGYIDETPPMSCAENVLMFLGVVPFCIAFLWLIIKGVYSLFEIDVAFGKLNTLFDEALLATDKNILTVVSVIYCFFQMFAVLLPRKYPWKKNWLRVFVVMCYSFIPYIIIGCMELDICPLPDLMTNIESLLIESNSVMYREISDSAVRNVKNILGAEIGLVYWSTISVTFCLINLVVEGIRDLVGRSPVKSSAENSKKQDNDNKLKPSSTAYEPTRAEEYDDLFKAGF